MTHETPTPYTERFPNVVGLAVLVGSVLLTPVLGLFSPLLAVALLVVGWSLRRTESSHSRSLGIWFLASGVLVLVGAIVLFSGMGTTVEFSSRSV